VVVVVVAVPFKATNCLKPVTPFSKYKLILKVNYYLKFQVYTCVCN
jgi:hypothetical protein